ncbi:MAG TPA: hypothetical protein VFQ92_16500 [Blastocatellia bacterium]|nr:hypothetical protein [Blastocatellia bacterium]
MVKKTLKIISLTTTLAVLLTSALAQDQQRKNASPTAKSKPGAAAQGGNTPGRIAKFATPGSLADSNITEDAGGNIGIGTTLPTSQLTVNGVIEMLSGGGIKFADGTLQTTAGIATVSRDATLKGDGTQAAPLGLAVPLNLNGDVRFGSVLVVSNTHEVSTGVTATGGPGGAGVRGRGGNSDFAGPGMVGTGGMSTTFPGGSGVVGNGGDSDSRSGGTGVIGNGGESNTDEGGTGVAGQGARGINGNGGRGVRALGGSSGGPGTRGGTGLEVVKGFGVNGGADGLAANFLGNFQVIGNTHVTGTLSKGGGSFKIDHPLDPENKYLSHSFVESPDMMNIYNGNITTDQNGLATVELPDYFESLNRDFRYQLTVVGQFAQAIVAEEVKSNRFTIQTSAPGVKVSWQVTGIRQDAWANKNRIPVEEVKFERERGHYLHPEAFGKEEERGVEWANHPELMREIKQSRIEAEQKRPKQR